MPSMSLGGSSWQTRQVTVKSAEIFMSPVSHATRYRHIIDGGAGLPARASLLLNGKGPKDEDLEPDLRASPR